MNIKIKFNDSLNKKVWNYGKSLNRHYYYLDLFKVINKPVSSDGYNRRMVRYHNIKKNISDFTGVFKLRRLNWLVL